MSATHKGATREEYEALIRKVGITRLQKLVWIDKQIEMRLRQGADVLPTIAAGVLMCAEPLSGLGLSDREQSLLAILVSALSDGL